MANTKKFIVKNGVTTPNISFKDSNLGATITATMNDSTDTLSFEGNAGQLFSITDALTGTLFTVSDISGIPSLEVDDQGIVRISEFNGYLVVGGDSALDTTGVTIQSGAISIRTDSSPSYVDFYCEVSNAHRTRLKSAAHATYSGNVDITLPVVTGTLLTTDGSGASLTNLNASNLASGTVPSARLSLSASDIPNLAASKITSGTFDAARIPSLATSKITSGTFDSARMPLGVFGGGGGGTVTEAFKTIAVSGQSDVVADAAADTLTFVAGSNMTITTNAGSDTITFASSGGGGGGTPGGSDTQVQFNDGGSFGGNAGMTFNKTTGVFAATSKSFDIDHPTKEGMRLRYGSLEGPENGVYVRGRLTGNNTIELPDYWTGLIDEDTITVTLTPIDKPQDLYVEDIGNNQVIIGGEDINCFYVVYGERKDVEKITVEYNK